MQDGRPLAERLKDLLDPLERERERLQGERTDLMAQRAKVDQELAQVERVLRILSPSAKREPKRKASAGTAVGAERLSTIMDHCMALARERRMFTINDILERMPGTSRSSVNAGLLLLREQEKIRKSGKDDRQSDLYALMEEEDARIPA